MQEFWEAYTILQKIFFVVAVPATLILVIQLILLLFGVGEHGASDTDVDADFDGADYSDLDLPDGPVGHGVQPDGADTPADGDGHPVEGVDHGLRIFTVRGVLTFFAVSGWAGLVMSYTPMPAVLIVLAAAALGVIAMLLMALLMKALLRLQYVPEVRPNSVIGKSAEVYITIPAHNSGLGKILVERGGQFVEMDAVTYSAVPLETGSVVQVTDVYGRAAVVERLEG